MDLRRISILFAAGALGGLGTVLGFFIVSAIGLKAPAITLSKIYTQVTWGGLWGLVFLIPLFPGNWILKGLVLGILPALALFFYFLPQAGAGLFGLNGGIIVPVMVLIYNMVFWGLVAAWWAKMTGAIDG